jgi:ATP-binding cassette subfamily B (MDR/TAP) protein 7
MKLINKGRFFSLEFGKNNIRKSLNFSPTTRLLSSKRKIVDDNIDLRILKEMGQYVWPPNNNKVKARVAISVTLLVGGKLLNVQVPILFKHLIDNLNTSSGVVEIISNNSSTIGLFTSAGALLIGYGIARLGASVLNEFKNVIFANVSQLAIRNVSRSIFAHLHTLDLNWHLSRNTGGLSRALDRGTKFFFLTDLGL